MQVVCWMFPRPSFSVPCTELPTSKRLESGNEGLTKTGRGLWRICLSQYISFHPPPLSELKSLKPSRTKGEEEDEEFPIKNLKIRPDILATCHTCETLVASWLLFIVQLKLLCYLHLWNILLKSSKLSEWRARLFLCQAEMRRDGVR